MPTGSPSCPFLFQQLVLPRCYSQNFIGSSLVYQNLGIQIKSRFWVRFNQYRVYWDESFEKSDIFVSVFPVSSTEPNRYKAGVYWIFEDTSEWMSLILFVTIVTILLNRLCLLCCSVTKLCQILCDPMDCSTPGLPCPSPALGVYSNSCPLTQWCYPTISSSVGPPLLLPSIYGKTITIL